MAMRPHILIYFGIVEKIPTELSLLEVCELGPSLLFLTYVPSPVFERS